MTHTAQHTPGPWRVSQVVHNSQLKPSDRRNYAGSIAYVYTDRPYPEGKCVAAVREELLGELEANAALIACSPELLAALEALLHEPMAERSVDMAKRAIAKAKGGA